MSFGRPYINQVHGCIHDGWLVLSPKKREAVHADFFYHLLGSEEFKRLFKKQAAGAVVKNLNTGIVKAIPIRIPQTVSEQRRIAAILDKADAIRRKREEALSLADDLLRSAFLEMFGDATVNSKGFPIYPLSRYEEFITSGSRGWAQYYSQSGRIFLRIGNVGSGRLKLDDLVYVNPPETAEAMRTRVQENDILLSITADLGRSAVVPAPLSGAHINQHLAILRLRGISPHYVCAHLCSPSGLRQFERMIISCASFMNSAKRLPLAFSFLKCGNTLSRTTASS